VSALHGKSRLVRADDPILAHRRILDAEIKASQWLADGNEAREAGDMVEADKCYAKSQYWLDKYNFWSGRM